MIGAETNKNATLAISNLTTETLALCLKTTGESGSKTSLEGKHYDRHERVLQLIIVGGEDLVRLLVKDLPQVGVLLLVDILRTTNNLLVRRSGSTRVPANPHQIKFTLPRPHFTGYFLSDIRR